MEQNIGNSIIRKLVIFLAIVSFMEVNGFSQSTLGVTGLLNSPSAEFAPDGSVRVGANFINEHLSPSAFSYNTFNYYLGATFLPFLEVAITNTAFKNRAKTKFINQDRAVSLKLRILRERRYWPAIAVGSNDAFTQTGGGSFGSTDVVNKHFGTSYIAFSKHLSISNSEIGAHLAYNILLSNTKAKMDFPVSAGISFSPGFYKKLNVILEYDTDNFNVGANALLVKYVFIQVLLQQFKYPSAGLCLQFYWK
ncbi:MAG: YjbH domain-containing protein [Rikenellaceae bacterium]|nr:YjbH domain-containing protein [Rikenellaceae bacterium]